MSSTHPNARAAQAGYGWAEIFLRSLDETTGEVSERPARPDYYYDIPWPPPPSPPPSTKTVPIFYMPYAQHGLSPTSTHAHWSRFISFDGPTSSRSRIGVRPYSQSWHRRWRAFRPPSLRVAQQESNWGDPQVDSHTTPLLP